MPASYDALDMPPLVEQVSRARCIRLVSYCQDGTPIPTPMWFVQDGDRLLVWTAAVSGKVERMRATPRVRVSTCTRRGVPTSQEVEGFAVPEALGRFDPRLLTEKYGWQKRVLDCYWWLRRAIRRQPKVPLVCLAVTFRPAAEPRRCPHEGAAVPSGLTRAGGAR